MKDFKILFSLFGIILLLFSCQKELDEAISPEFIDGNISERTDDPSTQTPDGTDCECFYIIYDYNGVIEQSAFLLADVNDDNDCSTDCASFHGQYSFDDCGESTDPCMDDLPSPDPNGTYPFNCIVSEGSNLTVRFFANELSLPNCTPGGGLEDNTITFAIMCTSADRLAGGNCPGYYYLTPPITVNNASPDIDVLIEDADCDCKPVIQ